MQSKSHWEKVYSSKAPDAVSWFQEHPAFSLRFIRDTVISGDASIIDVGGGASTLVDDLLNEGYSNLTVLDLSAAALQEAQNRLGERARQVHWIEADITQVDIPACSFDVWHDRAVFHFLTDPADRRTYVDTVMRAVKPGGHVIVATFAPDGPTQCSGLPVMRYAPSELHDEFGEPFTLVEHAQEAHHTPSGSVQQFVYCYCRKRCPSDR